MRAKSKKATTSPELEGTRSQLLEAASTIEQLQRALEAAMEGLPGPLFDPETDDPLNLTAAWQGTVGAVVNDELRLATASLRQAAAWTDDSASWRPNR
jgi:hypothetical protein